MDLPLQYIDPRYLSPKLEESEVTYHQAEKEDLMDTRCALAV
jgi:hypothetical protein